MLSMFESEQKKKRSLLYDMGSPVAEQDDAGRPARAPGCVRVVVFCCSVSYFCCRSDVDHLFKRHMETQTVSDEADAARLSVAARVAVTAASWAAPATQQTAPSARRWLLLTTQPGTCSLAPLTMCFVSYYGSVVVRRLHSTEC